VALLAAHVSADHSNVDASHSHIWHEPDLGHALDEPYWPCCWGLPSAAGLMVGMFVSCLPSF
jgi:hypothetical protein